MVPDPVLALLGKGGVLANDRSQRVRVVRDPRTGKLESRLLYNSKTITLPDNTKQRQIRIDASGGAAEVRKILLRELKRAKADSPAINVPSGPALDQLVETCMQNVQSIEQPEVIHHPRIDLASFRPGILKIAYELAFMWLGESYLDDPMAGKLRAVILGGMAAEAVGIRGTIELGCEMGAVRFWAADKHGHVAFSSIATGNLVSIALKIFDAFSAVIVVSEQADKYACGPLDSKMARFVHIDPAAGTFRESSVADEIARLCKAMRGQPPSQQFAP